MIVGIDEVGRGPWAGPLVFGAVVLGEAQITGLTDSKKLSKKRREQLSDDIQEHAKAIGLGWVSAGELDELGMSEALKVGCRRALEQITVPYERIILDGTINFLKDTGKGPYVTTMAKADLLVPSVSAASIVAKVARDRFMAEQDELFPGYNFSAHAGYGTATHRAALEKLGVSELHRKSFAPIATLLGIQPTPATKASLPTSGARAEDAASRYLQNHGFEVIARNWKTKACEIDIVAVRDGVTHFVEVKYRRKPDQGGGIAAITPIKRKHMERATRFWFQRYGVTDSVLSALEVSGDDFAVTQFLGQV